VHVALYESLLSAQRLAGHSTAYLTVSMEAPGDGEAVVYSFMADTALDLSPFPVSTEPLLAQLRWHDLSFEPAAETCEASALAQDCAEGALGIDWSDFLSEVCQRCDRHFCFTSKALLAAVDTIIANAWVMRHAQQAIPCAAGYFTALMIKSKYNAVTYSAFASVDASATLVNESLTMLQVVFRGMDVEGVDGSGEDAIAGRRPELSFSSMESAGTRSIFHTLPMESLAPFPLEFSAFHSLLSRRSGQEYSGWQLSFASEVAHRLASIGIFNFLVPGDASAEPVLLDELSGVTESSRVSIFVPVEFRFRLLAALRERRHDHIVYRNGLLQLGPVPYESPSWTLPFRVFCEHCVYVSFVFYLTDAEWVLPLHPWRPCRIPLGTAFPTVAFEASAGVVVQLARGALISGNHGARRLRMEYPPDDAGRAAFTREGDDAEAGMAGTCRRQLLELPEARQLEGEEGGGGAAWFPELRPEFDLASEVREGMSPVDLKMLRQLSTREGLVTFLDKIRLKRWCVEHEVEVPRIYFSSNTSPEIPAELLAMPRFVAKPSHLADASFVYVMRDGVNMINGNVTSAEEIQEGLRTAFATVNANDWATEHAMPGIMVEELIEPWDTGRGSETTPDELKCHAVWGELFFCQWVWVSHMSGDLGKVVAQEDWPLNRGHVDFGIPEFASSGYVFRDGSCVLCEGRPPVDWEKTLRMVETVAEGSDYLRVDIFVKDGRPVLNEVTITFAAIVGFQPEIGKELARRWLEGYQWRASR